jgi:serpin B
MVIVLLASALLACGQPTGGDVIRSAKQRIAAPQVSQPDQTTLVDGDSAFAFSLYQSLKGEPGNLFFSPFSISMALAMTYAGARGQTQTQMADTLHYLLPQDRLHPAYNALDIALSSRGKGAKGKEGEGFKLNIVNAIWGQKGFQFLPAYLDTLAQNYGAGLRILDFQKSPEESRVTINNWVAEQTADRIKDLIPQGGINDLTRLVLTNAIYFNAAWLYQFRKEATHDGVFYLQDKTQVTVPMMRQSEKFNYTEGPGYQAVELPYDGQELSMVIFLPVGGNFSVFERELTAQRANDIIANLESRQVNLAMPRFTFETNLGLKKTLSDMGMPVAFTDAADFSGMTGTNGLTIQDVIHKAFIALDENGTEAAAATAVMVGITSLPANPVDVTIDRPFIFLIRDIPTGTVLFLGRVLNPAK